jgi:predicted hotdog family 3-hydroxylacyl-ACP dehydratase
MGFVLGTKKYSNMIGHYSAGKTYTVEVESLYCDESIGSFKCRIIEPDGAICAIAEINAFSPEDEDMFLLEAMNG